MHGMRLHDGQFGNRDRLRWWTVITLVLLTIDDLNAYYTTRVTTKFGEIQGFLSRSRRGRIVTHYLGIPYAEPPVGDLRFRSPQPWNRTWSKVYDATENSPMCIQQDGKGNAIGSEDCLYLNVFVPISEVSENLPVLVFVHGEGFISGSSNSDKFPPDYLTDLRVILVTLNYRLNVLGFFSTANKVSPGNYALKDVVMALRWVHENIEYFGGDPNSVTLWGHSVGAVAVQALTLTNKTEGLFNRFILQSGSILAPWGVHSKGWIRKASLEAAMVLGCLPSRNSTEKSTESATVVEEDFLTEQPEEMVEHKSNNTIDEEIHDEQKDEDMMLCMRSVEAEKISRLVNNYHVWKGLIPDCPCGPTIEDDSDDAIITMDPLLAMKNHLFRDIPCIIGLVQDEGLLKTIDYYTNPDMADELIENFESYLPYELAYNELVRNTSIFADAIEKFYFDGNVIETFNRNITQLISDAAFTWPAYQTLKYQSEVMNASTYFYLFSYEGTFSNTFRSGDLTHYGVAHVDDLNYLIPLLNRKYRNLMLHNTENDVTMSNIMIEMWVSFASNGVPEYWGVIPWPDFKESHEFLRFGRGNLPEITIEHNFLPERIAFWNDLMTSEAIGFVKEENHNDSSCNKYNGSLLYLLISSMMMYLSCMEILT